MRRRPLGLGFANRHGVGYLQTVSLAIRHITGNPPCRPPRLMQGRSTGGRIVAPVYARAQRSSSLPNFCWFFLNLRLKIRWILCWKVSCEVDRLTNLATFSVFHILMVSFGA